MIAHVTCAASVARSFVITAPLNGWLPQKVLLLKYVKYYL